MLAKKNRNYCGTIIFLTLALFIAGCSPPGPRALLKGKKLLDRGDYTAAVEQFTAATTLMPTNAQAWNYLGVASQRAGQSADAVTAYQRALTLDRDLVEAHYNLGVLWLEQNKPADAKTEFTAYTLRRGNTPEGWLKLGLAELHSGDPVGADKSFVTALSLSTNNAEALNGRGLVRIEHGRPREAMQFFAAANQFHPDYAPAILNLATVAQQDLHDDKLALQYYREYLALSPRPANWDAVNAIADSLEPAATIATATTPPETGETKTQTIIRPISPLKMQTTPSRTSSGSPPQAGKIKLEPTVVASPVKVVVAPAPVVAPPPATGKTGTVTPLNPIHWTAPGGPTYAESGVTPLPAPPKDATAVRIVQPAPPTFPRYLYLSPRKPAAGNRGAATGAFTKAREFEQSARWTDAMQAYQSAARFDPSWFEAQYNYGVLSYRLRDFSVALAAFETALAIQPDSVDARYNFALALKSAGYAQDAVNELQKILAANPNEARAHLALGNLYAQQFHDPAQARQHYLKVLELDPHNPQANDIRFWLSANPG